MRVFQTHMSKVPFIPYRRALSPKSSKYDPNQIIINAEIIEENNNDASDSRLMGSSTEATVRVQADPSQQPHDGASTSQLNDDPHGGLRANEQSNSEEQPSPGVLWAAMQKEVDRERAKAERIGQRMMRRLSRLKTSQFSSGSDPDSASSSVPPGTHKGEAVAWATWMLSLVAVVVFITQWRPLVPVLLEGARRLDLETFIAFLLVAPETSFKMVGYLMLP